MIHQICVLITYNAHMIIGIIKFAFVILIFFKVFRAYQCTKSNNKK